MKIRVVKTASKASAVQVVRYQNNKRVILQHIGSAHNDEELNELILIAENGSKISPISYRFSQRIIPIVGYTSTTALLWVLNTIFSTS